jgi:nicotinamide mononucleotide transporter
MPEIFQQLVDGINATTWYEYIGVFAGIASVWLSKKENIWVYPVGLVNTMIYVYLSLKGHLYGEASVNVFYTIMSIYGWIIWARREKQKRPVLHITHSSRKEWIIQIAFFSGCYLVMYAALVYLKNAFNQGTIPVADAFASATAYTGMWLMTRKKVESWYWWILTNISSIPLYFVKGYVFSSFLFTVLLVMAFWGLAEWKQKAAGHNGHTGHIGSNDLQQTHDTI